MITGLLPGRSAKENPFLWYCDTAETCPVFLLVERSFFLRVKSIQKKAKPRERQRSWKMLLENKYLNQPYLKSYLPSGISGQMSQ